MPIQPVDATDWLHQRPDQHGSTAAALFVASKPFDLPPSAIHVRPDPLDHRPHPEERFPQVAGSLAFTTLLSIVPLLAASFALLARFRVFARFKDALQEFPLNRLLRPGIARTVLKYLNQFAANAHGLTGISSLFLPDTAIAMLLTVENALNQMWKFRKNQPFFRRVGPYLLMLAVGPPVLGLSLWATSYLLGVSMGLIGPLPPSLAFVLYLGPLVLGVTALTSMFYLVPNNRAKCAL